MNFFDNMRRVLGEDKVVGDKIKDIEIPDIAEKAMLDANLKAVEKEIERLTLNLQDIKFDHEKWWIKMRKKYNLATDRLHYDSGAFYEWEGRDYP